MDYQILGHSLIKNHIINTIASTRLKTYSGFAKLGSDIYK
ncbi:hypothetical protein AOT82_2406 [Psychrobacter sp. AntiMn-1]|nr:hypothetical protein AOT82_2406 [Psychrobacter sp. AntiMn-1]